MQRLPNIFFLIISAVLAGACSQESSEIGTDIFNGGALDVSYIDSSSVKLYTVKFDSMVVNGPTRVLAGSHEDGALGRITALAYIQPGVASSMEMSDDKRTFERATITLKYDDYFYYDTTAEMTLRAYRLTEELKAKDDGYFYNNTRIAHAETPLGSVTFRPTPHRADSVEIELDQAFGADLYQKMIDGSSVITTNENFLKFLRGFMLMADSTASTAMVGFAVPELRVYYYDRSVIPAETKYVTFPVSSSALTNKYFTGFVSNRSGTSLKQLPAYKSKLSASLTDEVAYLQSGSGLALRIDFPYLRDLVQANLYITQAVLEVYPVRKSYSALEPLPASMNVYFVNKYNTLQTQLSSATLIEDKDLGRDTRYQMDVTAFVKSQMKNETINDNGMLLILDETNYRGTVTRLKAASRSYEYKTILKIYYATVNK